MSPEYQAKLDDRDFNVDVKTLDEGGLLIVRVNGESFTVKAVPNDDGSWTVNDTATDFAVKVVKKSGNSMSMELNDQPRELEWTRVREQETKKPSTSAQGGEKRLSGGVYPPMPGKITEVRVKVGDEVKSDTTVCILEAMKMFNELKPSSSGIVKEVNISEGSMVTPTDLLILIE
ncbi:MAG: biotin/lipoyl-containing protein [Candidatus Thorarchaeota archaeon]|jgi:biotin carboxyl carrier protein